MIDDLFAHLRYNDFEVKDIEAYEMTFEDKNIVDYIHSPRRNNLLHLVTGGKRTYKINNEVFTVERNTLIFIPSNTRYTTVANNIENEKCSGIGICFNIKTEGFKLETGIYCKILTEEMDEILNYFRSVYLIQKNNSLQILEIKKAFYNLLSFLTAPTVSKSAEYANIEVAVEFINKNYCKNLPVKLYANKCNLSESYFRKKFSDFFGRSPIEYRNQLRFDEAKRLYQKNFTTQEIAERLGFCDAGYMLKLYKKQIGRTLKADAKIV